MTRIHLDGIKKIMSLLENGVALQDQYGKLHYPYQKEGFMFKEAVYFREYDYPTMQNPNFPCAKISNPIDFKPQCHYTLKNIGINKENSCRNCLFYNAKDKNHFKDFLQQNTLIPDIGIGINGKFTHWVEIVNTHSSSSYKKDFAKQNNIILLEVHVSQIEGEKDVIECFNLSAISEIEMLYINKIYSIYDEFKEKKSKSSVSISKALSKILTEDVITRIESGEHMDYQKVLDYLVETLDVTKDKLKSFESGLKGRIRKYNLSIYDFTLDKYSDELLVAIKAERKVSIVSKETAQSIQNYFSLY